MTPAEALRQAARAGRLARFEVSAHAMQRMKERHVTRADIASALMTATSAECQEGARFRFDGGRDHDGEALSLVAVLQSGCFVVTVF
jgi:hypothetical protein